MNFNEGDFVKVVMARNDVFSWQVAPSFNVKIVSRPRDTGDVWEFEVLLCEGYIYLAINPQCSEFVGLETHESH